MFNLMRMDMYHLKHAISTYVVLIFVVILGVFSVTMTNQDIDLMKEDTSMMSDIVTTNSEGAQGDTIESETRMAGVYIEPETEWAKGRIEIGSVISSELKSGLLAILCVIFVAIYTNAEQKNGYIKNIAGLFPNKEKLILSKIVIIGFQVFLMMAVFSITIVLTGVILWGNKFYMGSFVQLLKYLGAQYLMHFGVALVIMFFAILTKSSAFSMTTGILAHAGLFVPVYGIINKFIQQIGNGNHFDLNRYMLDGNITMMNLQSQNDILLRGTFTGIGFVLVSTILAMFIMKKRDI